MPTVEIRLVGDARFTIGQTDITPSAPHLFGLLLLLCAEGNRRRSRRSLQELLFRDDVSGPVRSHNLRQLLYRLRAIGVAMDDSPAGVRLAFDVIPDPLASFFAIPDASLALLPVHAFHLAPDYFSDITRAYAEWYEGFVIGLRQRVRAHVFSVVTRLRALHDWRATAHLASVLHALDDLDSHAVLMLAEARSMLGETKQALSLLDTYLADVAPPADEAQQLRRLRAAISRQDKVLLDPFVGRADCLLHLTREWERVTSSGARLTLITGAAGMGKTRLLSQFASTIALKAAHVLAYRCDSQTYLQPLALFSHVVTCLLRLPGSLGVSPQHLALLSRFTPGTPPLDSTAQPDRPAELLRSELRVAILDLFEAVTAERALLLTVDDAHHLDLSSFDLLHTLATSVNSAAILVVSAMRISEASPIHFRHGERHSIYDLPPLGQEEAESLAATVSPSIGGEFRNRHIRQAAGNPFFLRASLTSAAAGASQECVSQDLASLASESYHSLSGRARIVLESCLLLGRYADVRRTARVSQLDDTDMVEALRELETRGLLSCSGGILQGPPPVLADALREKIPKSVESLLRGHIGALLASEDPTDRSASLSIAAAEHLVAGGDRAQAFRLLQESAQQIASLGEPAAAARILTALQPSDLPSAQRKHVLDDIIGYADAGGERALSLAALRQQHTLAVAEGASQHERLALELRIVEARLLDGERRESAQVDLLALLSRAAGEPNVAVRCIADLLIIADAEFDDETGNRLHEHLLSLKTALPNDVNVFRAELVFHTSFGDTDKAYQLIDSLFAAHPEPTLNATCRRGRRFASFSLFRMLDFRRAEPMLLEDYLFTRKHSLLGEAMYAASLLTEFAISAGRFDDATSWFEKTTLMMRDAVAHKLSPNSGYYSSGALLSMLKGDYRAARAFIDAPQVEDARMSSPRYAGICEALRLRLALLENDRLSAACHASRLRKLFSRGARQGGQDPIAEVLWTYDSQNDGGHDASARLARYLRMERREPGPPWWLLKHSTETDACWREFEGSASVGRP